MAGNCDWCVDAGVHVGGMGKVRDTGGRWGMRRVPGMREHKRKARSLSCPGRGAA
jgi:hypothetical protein